MLALLLSLLVLVLAVLLSAPRMSSIQPPAPIDIGSDLANHAIAVRPLSSSGPTPPSQLATAIVEEMYVPGEGDWQSISPDVRTVVARNVQDLVYLADIVEDIPVHARGEIMEFVKRELLLEHSMRGLSPLDPDANKSVADRCDFSRWGCYDGSVAYTIDAMFKLGFPRRTLSFLQRTVRVTCEGCFGNRDAFSARIRK